MALVQTVFNIRQLRNNASITQILLVIASACLRCVWEVDGGHTWMDR